ncbi:hypothetical protein DERF_014353 [Dermatophagoides farinae]|uniref:Uncharacterized protein n=1 Tax=Dermatophagoides farinae TaxID=6954 RepID=A0A922HI34_DERFA|nr:hypothetical protein DERF_014353 [Dermatophagoides farinae]
MKTFGAQIIVVSEDPQNATVPATISYP